MKPGVFYFLFALMNPDRTEMYGFNITPAGMEKVMPRLREESNDDWYNTVVSDIEGKYGVHDWASSPDDRVEGIGYTSYEVEEDRIQDLMHQWQQTFIDIAGEENVGQIVKLPAHSTDANDWEIYCFIEAE